MPGRTDVPSGGAATAERWLSHGLALAAALLGTAGALSWVAGGGVFRFGPVSIGLQRPARAIAIGVGLLLLREVLRRRPGGRAAWRAAALVALLASLLAADSRPRLVGDAHEYVAMATNMSVGRPPALSTPDRRQVEAASGLDAGDLDAPDQGLVGVDGRQDFLHFWAYPLLAAPFVAAVAALGGPALAGFTVLNVLLLVGAAAVIVRQCGAGAVALLFAGPLLWWIDKPHPEVLFVSMLAAALALAPERPDVALLLAAVPAVQNPAFLPALAVATAWAWSRLPRAPRLLLCTVVAWAIASANPLYYLRHLGRAAPLKQTLMPHVPGPAEIWVLLGDSNLGLVPAWPVAGLAALASLAWAVALLARGGRRAGDALALVAAVGSLIVVSTQTANVNHGGTRGMSRYALWLTPFVVPLLARVGARPGRPWRVGLAAAGGLSLLSLFPEYLPARPERYLEPTPFARRVWTRHPGLERPLPEVFAERSRGRESTARDAEGEYPGVLPAATAHCEMALVRGDGSPVGLWPLACAPAAKPEACRPPGALCYAQAGREGPRFAPAPAQPGFHGTSLLRWYWTGTPDEGLARDVRAAPWAEMGLVDPRDVDEFVGARHGTGRIHLLTARGAFAVWFDRVRQADAWIEPRVRRSATARLVDPIAARELALERLSPDATSRIRLPAVSPLLLVVVDD
jgi:hypothetical protein